MLIVFLIFRIKSKQILMLQKIFRFYLFEMVLVKGIKKHNIYHVLYQYLKILYNFGHNIPLEICSCSRRPYKNTGGD